MFNFVSFKRTKKATANCKNRWRPTPNKLL